MSPAILPEPLPCLSRTTFPQPVFPLAAAFAPLWILW